MEKKKLSRREFLTLASAGVLSVITSKVYSLPKQEVLVEKPKGLTRITLTQDEKHLREQIRHEAKETHGCYLFGNALDEIESKIKSNLEQDISGNEFVVPENFLVKEITFSLEVDRTNLILSVYQEYNSQKILLLDTSVGLGGKNKDHSTGKWRDFSTPIGDYFIKRIIKDPWWYPPNWAKTKEPVKPGKDNPYGLWMSELSENSEPANHDWGISGDPNRIRIHSTNNLESIGKYASRGCIRLYPIIAENEFFPGMLYYSPHQKPETNSRGTIFPLENPIPITVRND